MKPLVLSFLQDIELNIFLTVYFFKCNLGKLSSYVYLETNADTAALKVSFYYFWLCLFLSTSNLEVWEV